MSKSPIANVSRLPVHAPSHQLWARARQLHDDALAILFDGKPAPRKRFRRALAVVVEAEDQWFAALEWERSERERMRARDEIRTGAELVLAKAGRHGALPTSLERARLLEAALSLNDDEDDERPELAL